MSNETKMDVERCKLLADKLDRFGGTNQDAAEAMRELIVERTQLHAVIAELVRLKKMGYGDGSTPSSHRAWQRAFDVADGEAK